MSGGVVGAAFTVTMNDVVAVLPLFKVAVIVTVAEPAATGVTVKVVPLIDAVATPTSFDFAVKLGAVVRHS